MAAGKSSKRVKLRTKAERRQRTQQATDEYATPPNGSAPSAPPRDSAGEAVAADRQVALRIRDALQQLRGRTGREPTAKVSGAGGVRRARGSGGATRQPVKSAKKDAPSSQRTTALRRATVLERRRRLQPKLSAAEERMAAAQEELQLFDTVQTVPEYAANPFAAVMQHLSDTMDVLQPQTPDVGRAERVVGAGHRR
ncbi:hypothetical protein LSCM1_08266 [Leishmania martiniquensis]|uniref:Ribosome biogenesis protein SLX9 n=1 Tax=Leishmania martiniquensis TaxID=1580590 RepID=A0A836H6Z3_9TRYP|nr:hypothetical protein LSCM1_08266 [Leishmania martiniquensis]